MRSMMSFFENPAKIFHSSFLLTIAMVTFSACTSLEQLPPPGRDGGLASTFSLQAVSYEELVELAASKMREHGVTVVQTNASDGVILGTAEPRNLHMGQAAQSALFALLGSELLIRVDVRRTAKGQAEVHILAKKKSAVLPGDPYKVQRDFIDELRAELSGPKPNKSLSAKALIIDEVDRVPPPRSTKQREGYAVLIGIESYRDLPKVDYAVRDVEAMRDYLTNVMGYPEQNIVVRTNERAGRSDLESYLEHWLERNVPSGAEVFIYYAGHGSPDPATGQPYLVPFDGDPSFLSTSAYSIDRLHKSLAKLPAKRIIVVLDSCFSGMGGRSVIAKGARGIRVEPSVMQSESLNNLIMFTASEHNQISSMYDEKKHGLFTYYFLKGLRGESDTNHDGKLTVDEQYQYVRGEVTRQSRRTNVEQTPQLLIPTTSGSEFSNLPLVMQ